MNHFNPFFGLRYGYEYLFGINLYVIDVWLTLYYLKSIQLYPVRVRKRFRKGFVWSWKVSAGMVLFVSDVAECESI